MNKIAILFVCLGNICRSPVAEGVFRKKIEDAGYTDNLTIDSAGTAAWHVGKSPDDRMTSAAHSRGYDLSPLRARQVTEKDFENYDFLVAMDDENYDGLMDIRPEAPRGKIVMFLDYAKDISEKEVPDPYFGGDEGFHHVIDLVENAADGLIESLKLKSQ